MTEIKANVGRPQPEDVVTFMTDIQAEQQRILGAGHSRNLVAGRGLIPSTYIAACLNAADRAKNDNRERYYSFLDFIHRVRCAINSLATKLGAAASERTYLAALVDMLAIQPSLVLRGNYQVCLTARDAGNYVALSSSSCTAARNSLIAKGLIVIDGDRVDLSPLIETLEPVLSDMAGAARPLDIQEAPPAEREALPESGRPRSNVKSNVPIEKTVTVDRSDDLFTDEAIRETISLSPRLQHGIENLISCDIRDASTKDILRAIPSVSNSLLGSDDFDYSRAWKRHGWVKHGLHALSALVAALELPQREPGKWYWHLLSRDKLDASSNIRKLIASRQEAQRAAERAMVARKASDDQARSAERQSVLAQRALKALEEVRASGAVSASDVDWTMAPARIYAKDNGSVVSWALRCSSNSTEKTTLVSIAKAVSERLQLPKFDYQFGVFAGTGSLSSYVAR